MNWKRIRVVMRKDLGELGANPMVVIPMAVVPAVMCVIVPCAIVIAVLSVGAGQLTRSAELIARLTPLYDAPAAFKDPVSRPLYVVLNYTFLPMFMIVPVMMATLVSANAIDLVSFLPAIVLSWMVFVAFFAAANAVSLAMIRRVIVRSWIWIPSLLLLSPAVSLVGLSLTLLISLRAKTFQPAQQFAALVVVPLIAVVVMQITGLVILNALYVVLASLALLAVAWVLIARVLPRFTREGIISTL